MKLTTTEFNCPTHGPQVIEFPAFIERRVCNGCIADLESAVARAEHDYRREHSRWAACQRSGVPRRQRSATLTSWIAGNRSQEKAKAALNAWTESFDDRLEDGLGLLLLGPVGTGKTHLLCALTTAVCRMGVEAAYISWPDALDRHKATFNTREHVDRNLLESLATVPVLTLDELGIRAGSDFDQALLFQLIDTRYREERITLAASNLTESTLDAIGERTADRFRECALMVSITGASQRSNVRTVRPLAIQRPEPWVVEMTITVNGKQELARRTGVPDSSPFAQVGALTL